MKTYIGSKQREKNLSELRTEENERKISESKSEKA